MLGWPSRCELARAFLLEDSDKELKLAQVLGQLGVNLTLFPFGVAMVICPPVVNLQGKIHRVDPDFGSILTVSSREYQSNC